jgi:hypothetical protein
MSLGGKGKEKNGKKMKDRVFWGKPFEKGCPPNPFPKLFVLAPTSAPRLRLWRIMGKDREIGK